MKVPKHNSHYMANATPVYPPTKGFSNYELAGNYPAMSLIPECDPSNSNATCQSKVGGASPSSGSPMPTEGDC